MDTNLEALKQQLDREIGYECDGKGMFKIRQKVHTVSAYINKGENNV